MAATNIVIGQRVASIKIQKAKDLRQHMTEAEQVLWQRLRTNQLGGWHFRRQQVIGGFVVDFYCHAASLAIEVDGPIHGMQVDYDMEGDRVLAAYGVRVLRIKNQEVLEDIESVLTIIHDMCRGVSDTDHIQ